MNHLVFAFYSKKADDLCPYGFTLLPVDRKVDGDDY